MADLENYFEKQQEVLALKEKLRHLKNQEKLFNVNKQLQKLAQINKEIQDNVSNFNENCKFVRENVQKVDPLLKTNSKINMKQDCAEKLKDIVRTMPKLKSYSNSVRDLQLNNLNVDTETLIESTISRINTAKMNLHYSSVLFDNVKKLTNPEAAVSASKESAPLIIVTDPDQQNTVCSNDFMNSTTASQITFSGVTASSPLHERLEQIN